MFKINFCIITLLLIDVRAPLLRTVSKELAKLIPKRNKSNEGAEFIPLHLPLEKYEFGRKDREVDIALLTDQLGFVYCDVMQNAFMGEFAEKYAALILGHGAVRNTLDLSKAQTVQSQDLINECQRCLQDEVLQDNNLRLIIVDDYINQIKFVEKNVVLDYYLLELETISALQCPVKVDEKVRLIYFSARGITEQENAKHYFVFSDYSDNDDSKITVLMRTVETKFSNTYDTTAQRERIVSKIFDHPDKCPIRIHVKPKHFEDEFRLFGKAAEAAFITQKYRFFNTMFDQLYIDRFINTVQEMKNGYETEPNYNWFWSLRENIASDIATYCFEYVVGATHLQQYAPTLDDDDRVVAVRLVDKTISLKSMKSGFIQRKLSFFQCPAIFRGKDYAERVNVNIIPIQYKSSSECRPHGFYMIDTSRPTSEESKEIFISPVDLSVNYEDSSESGPLTRYEIGSASDQVLNE